jgi:hypothetical protein
MSPEVAHDFHLPRCSNLSAIEGTANTAPYMGGVAAWPMVARAQRPAMPRACQSVAALVAGLLAIGTAAGWLTRDAILALVFVSGSGYAAAT